MPTNIPSPKLATTDVDAEEVATQTQVALRRQNQAVRQGAGQAGGIRIVDADGGIASTDTFVLGDTTVATVTLTLPLVSEYTRMYVFVERYAGANTFTVAPRGTDTIDGGGSITVTKFTILFPAVKGDWHAIVLGN